ncbi:MAG: type II secretion system protein [Candidatus Liptonbacteria bacterium]|nr:type II secretion system protein [Candidatus Liptonbacteria bacterium]
MRLPLLTYRSRPTGRHQSFWRVSLITRGGFTLVELLVVVSITLMLSAYAVTYSRDSKARTTLTVEEAKAGLFIQRAKSLALATRLRSNLERPCGYGVEVDYTENTLKLFTYSGDEDPRNGNECVTIGTAAHSSRLGKDIVETIGFSKGIKLYATPPPTSRLSLEQVFFKAPDPITFIWAAGFSPDELSRIPDLSAEITLQWGNDEVMQETIRVTKAGEVSF